jgi:hypothetical protein
MIPNAINILSLFAVGNFHINLFDMVSHLEEINYLKNFKHFNEMSI